METQIILTVRDIMSFLGWIVGSIVAVAAVYWRIETRLTRVEAEIKTIKDMLTPSFLKHQAT